MRPARILFNVNLNRLKTERAPQLLVQLFPHPHVQGFWIRDHTVGKLWRRVNGPNWREIGANFSR